MERGAHSVRLTLFRTSRALLEMSISPSVEGAGRKKEEGTLTLSRGCFACPLAKKRKRSANLSLFFLSILSPALLSDLGDTPTALCGPSAELPYLASHFVFFFFPPPTAASLLHGLSQPRPWRHRRRSRYLTVRRLCNGQRRKEADSHLRSSGEKQKPPFSAPPPQPPDEWGRPRWASSECVSAVQFACGIWFERPIFLEPARD